MSETHIDIATKEYADQIGSKIDSHVIQKGNPHNMTPIDIGAQPNQNMLDNWYFGNPVNRNGLSEYTGLQDKVSIDRWMMSDENLKLTINSDHVTFTNQGICTGYFYQYLDTSFDLLNLPITLSCLTAEGEVYTGNTTITDITPDNPNMVTFPITDYLDFGIGYFADTQKWAFIFRCHDAEHETTINIVAAKIEYGNIQTLAAKNVEDEWMLCELPKFAQEVVKCAQYNITTGEYLGLVPEAIGAVTPEYIESKIEEVTTTLTDDISKDISSHDSSSTAHADIRNLVRSLTEGVTSHTTNNNNPHGITADQIGAFAKVTGLTGQLLGFTDTNIIGAVDAPSGKQTCRVVVGTSTAGWTEADCDYLCDGIDDQVEINAAIQALSDYGGEIKVLDGEYRLTDAIIADKNNLRLCGSGKGTIFKRYYNSSSNDNGLIYFDGPTKRQNHYHQFYENFLIDGNSESYNTGSGLVIKGTYTNPERGSEDISISNVSSYNNSGYGIAVIYAKKVSIIGNVIVNNGTGICVDSTESTVVAGNTVTGGTLYGISLDSTADAAITGNTIVDISSQAIVSYGKRCTVCGNTIINAGRYGVYGYSSKTSAIVGNTIVKEDSYTSSQYSIYLGSSSEKNIVVGNICTGKAPTVEGSGNVIENNLV